MSALVSIAYFFIMAMCVGLSTYSTYHGFEPLFGRYVTGALTLAVAAGLLVCDYMILQLRGAGQSVWRAVAAMLLFTAFSWSANFSFFYSQVMSNNLAVDRYAEAAKTFEDNMIAGETALGTARKPFDDVKLAIDAELKQLAYQIRDQVKPGIGTLAKEHITKIHGQLKQVSRSITEPAHGSKSKQDDEKFIALFTDRVREAVLAAEQALPWSKALESITRARKDRAGLEQGIGRPDAADASDRHMAGIKRLRDETLKAEREIKLIFEVQKTQWAGFPLKPTADDGVEVRSITNRGHPTRRSGCACHPRRQGRAGDRQQKLQRLAAAVA